MAATQERTNKIGVNQFRFSGKVVKKTFQFAGSGNLWGTLQVEIPSKKEQKYNTKLQAKFFAELAEKAEAEINEGVNVLVYGYIKPGSYMNEKTGSKVYTTDFVAAGYDLNVSEDTGAGDTEKSKDDVPF